MRAAGRWRATSPLPDTRLLAACRSRSRLSSGSFSALMEGARGQGLEAVEVCSLSPPLSCSNSTLSLLSPLGYQSFSLDDDDGDGEEEEEDVDEDAHDSEDQVESLRGMELQGAPGKPRPPANTAPLKILWTLLSTFLCWPNTHLSSLSKAARASASTGAACLAPRALG